MTKQVCTPIRKKKKRKKKKVKHLFSRKGSIVKKLRLNRPEWHMNTNWGRCGSTQPARGRPVVFMFQPVPRRLCTFLDLTPLRANAVGSILIDYEVYPIKWEFWNFDFWPGFLYFRPLWVVMAGHRHKQTNMNESWKSCFWSSFDPKRINIEELFKWDQNTELTPPTNLFW